MTAGPRSATRPQRSRRRVPSAGRCWRRPISPTTPIPRGGAPVLQRELTTVLTTRVLAVVATPDLSGVAGDRFASTPKTRAWQTVNGPARALLSPDETGAEIPRRVGWSGLAVRPVSAGDTGVVSATRAASTTTGPS